MHLKGKGLLCLFSLFLCSFISLGVADNSLLIRNLWEGTHTVIVKDKNNDKIVEENTIRIYKKLENGEDLLYVDKTGQTNNKDFLTYSASSSFLFKNHKLFPLKVVQTYEDQAGKVSKIISREYDWDRRKVVCAINEERKCRGRFEREPISAVRMEAGRKTTI